MDRGGLWAAGAALAATVALAALLIFVSRSVNRPPVIVKVDVQPAIVAPGGTATVRVFAEDPDGDVLRAAFKAQSGQLAVEIARPMEARYSPGAAGSNADSVTITVSDSHGLSSSMQTSIGLAGAAAAPAATPEAGPTPPADVPVAAAAPMTETAAPPPPAKATAPTAVPTLPPTPTPKQNRAPVLDGGFTMRSVGNNPIRLMANGSDPDDDPITHEWDMGGCFEIVNETAYEAEVKFAEGCTGGDVQLHWTDPQGARASTRWAISK